MVHLHSRSNLQCEHSNYNKYKDSSPFILELTIFENFVGHLIHLCLNINSEFVWAWIGQDEVCMAGLNMMVVDRMA